MYQGCPVRFFEQGFDKNRESYRTLELFEQFDVQF